MNSVFLYRRCDLSEDIAMHHASMCQVTGYTSAGAMTSVLFLDGTRGIVDMPYDQFHRKYLAYRNGKFGVKK